jgi:signal transduction histidine kinase
VRSDQHSVAADIEAEDQQTSTAKLNSEVASLRSEVAEMRRLVADVAPVPATGEQPGQRAQRDSEAAACAAQSSEAAASGQQSTAQQPAAGTPEAPQAPPAEQQ